MICKMFPKKNYLAFDKGKHSTCRVFIETETILFSVYPEFWIINLIRSIIK